MGEMMVELFGSSNWKAGRCKTNSFDCRTWNGQAARVVVGYEMRRESSGVSVRLKEEGQCLVG
jgi:hypothetical protein